MSASAGLLDPRAAIRRIAEFGASDPAIRDRYENAKQVVRIFRKPAFYEITQRCNLKCEGCYYFEGSPRKRGAGAGLLEARGFLCR